MGPILGEKTSWCRSVDLSTNRSITIDNNSLVSLCFSHIICGERRRRGGKRRSKNKGLVRSRSFFKLTYFFWYFLSAFFSRECSFHLVNLFRGNSTSIIQENLSKPDLSSGVHMGNQMLPSIPAASPLCLKNVCRSLSTVWNYSPGWAEKRHSAKEWHLDSTQCPFICHDSAAQHRHNLQKCLFFCGAS